MAAESNVPILPIDQAAGALIHVDPVLGSVVVLMAAALVGVFMWATRTIKAKDDALALSHAEHAADLKTGFTAMHELKDVILNAMSARRAR